ncbi:MAG: hypothetical protein ACLQBX_09280 [Candidatus Limnocylindrales bacterium]
MEISKGLADPDWTTDDLIAQGDRPSTGQIHILRISDGTPVQRAVPERDLNGTNSHADR